MTPRELPARYWQTLLVTGLWKLDIFATSYILYWLQDLLAWMQGALDLGTRSFIAGYVAKHTADMTDGTKLRIKVLYPDRTPEKLTWTF